ncbi:hypothetical protein [Rhodococcus opacus]|uniref:hypothetical protein n=1 Tax=Rhodococcus opacus TaxID=37919 RepID=UPI0026D0A4EC
MIELDGLEGYPGCGAIVYDALRAAMFVRALRTEMMARNAYIHHKKIEGSQLPLMIAVLDEFFILSGKWQRLAKTGDDATRERLEELDPRATRGTRPESDSRNSTRERRATRERLEELDPLGAWAACSVSRRSGRFSVRRRQRSPS